jgi:hypothetical protein
MKNISKIIALLVLVSCNSSVPSQLILQEELNDQIDQWHEDASVANYKDYFGFIAEDGVFIGTDITERWTKEEFSDFSKPYFDSGKAWSFKSKERTIRFNKDKSIAWFDEVLDTWMGDCRASGILSHEDEEWKLEHYQLSVTIDNDLMNDFLELTIED